MSNHLEWRKRKAVRQQENLATRKANSRGERRRLQKLVEHYHRQEVMDTYDEMFYNYLVAQVAREEAEQQAAIQRLLGKASEFVERLGFDPNKLDIQVINRLPEERIAAALGIPGVHLIHSDDPVAEKYGIPDIIMEPKE